MAHTSLYRKYRPATFDDVVGQQHIERTLRNAICEGTTSHAYLFTGPRGTGKTTTARLLAKALLCERGPTDEPDGTCEQCIEIAEGRHPDVYELDAASRTGVDNVREEIIGRVSYGATRGRYKIYIIDEVHMLSTAAFNALLKTLEEPPAHVIFVMCTTHPNKVPETIQSRCQRFDFRRLSVEDIADRLRFIAEAEGIRAERGVFALISRHAEGGMRDAITSLEQLAAYTGGEITTDDVEGMLNEVDAVRLFEVAALIARRDVGGAFRWVASEVETGTDLSELVRELTAHIRDLFVIAAVGDATGVVDRPDEDIAALESQAVEFGGPDRLGHILDLLGELGAEMRWSSDPRLSLEVALTRMARPQGELTLGALAERVEALELGIGDRGRQVSGARPESPPAAGSAKPQRSAAAKAAAGAESSAEPEAAKASTSAAPQAAASQSHSSEASAPTPAHDAAPRSRSSETPAVRSIDKAAVRREWPAVLVEIKKLKPARVQTFSQAEVDIDADGRTLVIEFPAEQQFSMQLAEEADMRELVKRALAAVFGAAMPFRYQLGRGGVRPVEESPEAVCEMPEPKHAATSADDDSAEEPPAVEQSQAQAAPGEESSAHSSLEELLVQGLGATIVGEHQHEPEGEDV